MDKAEQHTPSGWSGGLKRWFGSRPAVAPSKALQIDRTPPWQEQLHRLTLDIAACEQLRQELPALLRPLQQALRLEPGQGAACHLLLALTLPGQPESSLLHPPDAELPPGLPGFLRYQFDGPLRELSDAATAHHPLLLPVPGSTFKLHLQPLQIATINGWLVLLSDAPLSHACAQRLSSLAQAIGEGLAIWSRHQQQLEQAIAQERQAQAAELHDSLAQILGYLRLGTARLDARCGQCNQPELQAIAADLSQQTRHAYRLMRELISRARLTLEGGSLHCALSAAVREFEQRSALVFELDDRCLTLEPDENSAIQLVMIVREALCNAVRHAHASHLRLQLLPAPPNGLRLRIEDNGQGIDPARKRQDSFGLGIMQERAARIGAALTIGERPGGGTRIELHWSGADHD